MPNEAQQEENNPHRGKAGVLASIQASVGTINLKGELGQGENEWKLWRYRFEWARRWRGSPENNWNSARTAYELWVASPEVKQPCWGTPKHHFGVLQAFQHQMALWLTEGRLWNELQRTRATLWVSDNYRKHYHHASSEKKGNRELQRELIWKIADLKSVRETARSVWNSYARKWDDGKWPF